MLVIRMLVLLSDVIKSKTFVPLLFSFNHSTHLISPYYTYVSNFVYVCASMYICRIECAKLFSYDMLIWWASNSCRYTQMVGLQYWCPWTTKVYGIWGLQYGKGSILGNNYISGFGLLSAALLMNMIFPTMHCFVAKLLDITTPSITINTN